MRPKIYTAFALGLSLCASPLLAQGDDCSTATPITGPRAWTWSTTGWTSTQFQVNTPCGIRPAFGLAQHDVFFEFTPSVSGAYQFTTENSLTDSAVAVFEGVGCTAICVQADTLGQGYDPQAQAFGNLYLDGLIAGQPYLVRVAWPVAASSSVALDIVYWDAPCFTQHEDSLEPNDDIDHWRKLLDGSYPGLGLTSIDRDYYYFQVAPGATVQVDLDFVHAAGNVQAVLWEMLPDYTVSFPFHEPYVGTLAALGQSATDDETLTWTNPKAHNVALILGVILESQTALCQTYDLTLSGTWTGAPTSTPFCDPMLVNSAGLSTTLTASFQPGVQSGLHFEVTQGPARQFGYLLLGSAPDDTSPLSIGEGLLCLSVNAGNFFVRYNGEFSPESNSIGQFDGNGVLQNLTGTSVSGSGYDVPQAIPRHWTSAAADYWIWPGQSWHFQYWHREPNGSSNFSNGLSVQF